MPEERSNLLEVMALLEHLDGDPVSQIVRLQLRTAAMIPTTTIMTKDRVYVPVPRLLEPAFQIAAGAKEFYVRFDTIP